MLQRLRRLDLLTIAWLLAAGMLEAGVVAILHHLDPFASRPFSPDAWAAADSQSRGPMARDAIRNLLSGMSAADVRALLGEPGEFPGRPGSSVDGFGNRLPHHETWAYYIGSWSGLGPYNFDSAFLYVHFGPDGRVVAVEVTGG
jgi:hypothetical protein